MALLKPREQLFGGDLAYAFLLGTALLQTGDAVEGQKYVDRIFGAGDSAEAHLLMGIAHLGQQDYPRREDRARARREAQSAAADGQRALRPIAAGARRAGRRRARLPSGARVESSTTSKPTCSSGTCASRRSTSPRPRTYLERATTIRPNDLTARKLLGSLRLQTGNARRRWRCSKRSRRKRPTPSKCTSSSPRPTTA